MHILEGKAYCDGLELICTNKAKTLSINARRNVNKTVEVVIKDRYSKNETFIFRNILGILFLVIFLFLFALLCKFFSLYILKPEISIEDIIFILSSNSLLWCMYFLYGILYSLKNKTMVKFHMASHMVLNYYYNYNEMPTTIEDVLNESSTIAACPFTLIPCTLFCFSLILTEMVLLHNVILLMIYSCLVVKFASELLVRGFFDSFQKMFLESPTMNEIEIALGALSVAKEIARKEEEEYGGEKG